MWPRPIVTATSAPETPNPARLHRLSTVSFWGAPGGNCYPPPTSFAYNRKGSELYPTHARLLLELRGCVLDFLTDAL
jgi:hypothetical protein